MIDLAEQHADTYVPLRDIAQRQKISQKYLEAIMTILSKNGFVTALHGKGGGYKLNRQPSEYKVGEILRLTEGTLAPVSCLECGAKPCERVSVCRTLPLWTELGKRVSGYLDSVTIADFMKKDENDVLKS